MSSYEKSQITQAVERKQQLKKNVAELVEQTQDVSSSFNIALSALKNGQPETALKKFEQVLRLDRSEDMLRQVKPNLGQAWLQLGDIPAALREFRSALKLNPPDEIKAFIYANLGYIYTQQHFHGFAIREYRQALKENKRDQTSLLTLGMLYENAYRYADARDVFQRLLKQDPENTYAKERLAAMDEALPVVARHEPVRLVHMLQTLGLIVVMSYDQTYDGYFPMVIYLYPESPLKELLQPGQKILNVFISGGEDVAEDDERDLLQLLQSAPDTDVGFLVGEEEFNVRCIKPIQRKIELNERITVYKNWLQTFDNRLAWLWAAPLNVREEIGPLWGMELESLVMELKPLQHTYVYDFAYALMVEHLQAFRITETDPETQAVSEIEIQYQIHLGRYFGKPDFAQVQAFPDLIQQFNEVQFQYLANLLASRV
ncbi:MAG: tetratricopeptide repeat protein [Candidatus Sericytochromatia bacterium]|nr:tetratricopeptide repeat protein [Candidatus Sericytochromatia bacterium]